jgi:rhodanese-related sulfurtransferase
MNTSPEPDSINIAETTRMSEVLRAFPGAQRALFRKYHIGGCSSCGFGLNETLGEVCARNGSLNTQEVLDHLKSSHEADARVLIEPAELQELRKSNPRIRLVDIRSREEFDAVHIDGSQLLSQELMKEIMAEGSNDRPLVVVDHSGRHGLDAAAYFSGHGLQNVRCLRGGIDAWAEKIEPELRRYRLED